MKNMIELPTEADYHKTALIDIREAHQLMKKADTISYKKCIVNFRSIVDISEKEIFVNVIDEDKYPEYEALLEKNKKKREESLNRRKPLGISQTQPVILPDQEYEVHTGLADLDDYIHISGPPHITIKMTGTLVLYFNGLQRFVVDDFEEFQEKYFNYLKMQKLDIIGK